MAPDRDRVAVLSRSKTQLYANRRTEVGRLWSDCWRGRGTAILGPLPQVSRTDDPGRP